MARGKAPRAISFHLSGAPVVESVLAERPSFRRDRRNRAHRAGCKGALGQYAFASRLLIGGRRGRESLVARRGGKGDVKRRPRLWKRDRLLRIAGHGRREQRYGSTCRHHRRAKHLARPFSVKKRSDAPAAQYHDIVLLPVQYPLSLRKYCQNIKICLKYRVFPHCLHVKFMLSSRTGML